MKDVKSRLGVDDFAEVEIRDMRFKAPYIGELMQTLDCPSVEEYNRFAADLENIWQRDGALLTYAAVLDAERPETLHEAHELLRDLDNYQRITDVYGYGQICMENDGVITTEFGRLRRVEPTFKEQAQEMRII